MSHTLRALALFVLFTMPATDAFADPHRPGPPPRGSDHGHGGSRPAPRPTQHPAPRPAPHPAPNVRVVVRPSPPAPRRVVIVERPTVHFRVPIGFDPWSQRVMPAPRTGWVWVDGGPDPYGGWMPGTWRPYDSRAGYVWEPGYWSGLQYVDGYWRPVERTSWLWQGGHYEGRGWVSGRWIQR